MKKTIPIMGEACSANSSTNKGQVILNNPQAVMGLKQAQ